MSTTVAIIPARGGSKRIPRKNIKEFGGRPMIAWSIAAAKAAGVFDAIVVSTDDPEVAAVAVAHGAEVPFVRQAELATDFAGTIPVIGHALNWWEAHRGPVKLACCIYATAPFIQPEYLVQGHDLLLAHPEAEFVFSVTSYAFPIFRALSLAPNGRVGMFWPEHELKRSQELPEALHDAGQFYWGTKRAFTERQGFFSAISYPVKLPRRLVQDIDTPEDWAVAEAMIETQGFEHV